MSYQKNINYWSAKPIYYILVFIICLTSCSTKKQIVYLQDIDVYNNTAVVLPDNTIQPNDILSIQVSSAIDEEASEPYNKQNVSNSNMNGNMQGNLQMLGYLVSKELMIKLPVLGEVSTAGKTLKGLEIAIEKRLIEDNHLNAPTVMVTLLNAKFTTLGEMGSGTHYFNENNLTILQAIGKAGDLDIRGRRDDIVIIREVDGVRQIGHVDLTASNLLDSPYYFIKPNDVIYVKPNEVRVRSAGFITGPSALIGFATLLVTTALLIKN
jgi:polysaccharide export outer membrane protein